MTKPEPQRPYVGAHLLLIDDQNRLLLMKRTVKDEMDGLYALIAGKVDVFENPSTALARETFEESGIQIDAEDLEHIVTIHHAKTDYKAEKNDVIEFYFRPKKWTGTPVIAEPDKASELKFFPLDQLPEPISPWIKHVLQAMNDNRRFIEFSY